LKKKPGAGSPFLGAARLKGAFFETNVQKRADREVKVNSALI
jgi:hypothetical protein